MKRSGPLKRGKPLKRSSIKRKPKPRRAPAEQERLIRETRAFREEARRQRVCAVCGRTANIPGEGPNPWEAHHVITRSFLKRNRLAEFHPDNSLRLCSYPCHALHSTAALRIPLTCLTDRNVAYAVRLLGEAKAHDYLTRHYTGTDPRVEALLEEDTDG